MADDETAEETSDPAPETGDGGNEDSPDQDAAEAPSGESAEMPVDHKEPLTPNRAAKLAGIGVLAAFLVAVIVVAALWAVDAILDDDYEYYEPQDSDDAWFQYVEPSALKDGDSACRPDALWGGDGKGPFASHEQWIWPDKDHSDSRGFATKDGACGMPFGSRARTGPVVVVVLGGAGLGSGGGLGDWGYAEGFGFGGGGVGPRGLLPNILPFSDDPSTLMDFFGASGLELPELQDELSLEATELDNEAPPAVEGLTPT